MQYAIYKPHLIASEVFSVFYTKENPYLPYLVKCLVSGVNVVKDKDTYYHLTPLQFISGKPTDSMTLRCVNKLGKSKDITFKIDHDSSLNWVQQFALNDDLYLEMYQYAIFDNINDAIDLINKLNNGLIQELTEATGNIINQNNELMKIRYGI